MNNSKNNYLEKEFYSMLEKLKNQAEKAKIRNSYSLLGSPLFKSKVLILGNNWGGDPDEIPNQESMPECNDILCSKSQTYSGYISFFNSLFENTRISTILFLQNIVYTNASLIRFKNEKQRMIGYELSESILSDLIKIVEPKIIIAFGNKKNGSYCAAYAINELFPNKIFIYQDSVNEKGWLASKYIFENFEIYLFPHGSKFGNIWGKDILHNSVFISLKESLKVLF